jgi:hypothetical protein
MENKKPISDLERIQQSYSSGSQKYVPAADQSGSSKKPEAARESSSQLDYQRTGRPLL